MGVLTRSLTLGLAAGGRSTAGLAVPVLAATKHRHGVGARALQLLVKAAVVGESVMDKQPATPSRLVLPVLYGRVAAGALGAASLSVVERRSGGAHLVALLAGGVGAFAGSVAGAAWRDAAAESGPDWLQPDWRAALVEDGVVLASVGALVATSHPEPHGWGDGAVHYGHA